MRQFQVPQFITVEDKVVGPFTIKQFAFIAAGGLLIVFLKSFFEGTLLFILSIMIAGVALGLAFLKINEQSLPVVIKNAFFYLLRPRLFIWKQEDMKKNKKTQEAPKEEVLIKNIPKLSVSKLTDLAWSLDLKEKIRQEQ